MRCALAPTGVSPDLIVGGQGTYVTLASSNVTYDAGTHVLSSDVSVTNLIPQALGTNDGVTGDGTGLRIFFDQVPTTTSGTGVVTVSNATGTGTFTASNQPYFLYPGTALGGDDILSTNETSATVQWQFTLDPTVTTFEFYVYVSANVHYPNGYVDAVQADTMLNQAATSSITATSRTAVGNAVTGSTLSYASTAPAVATVNTSGVITAVAPGFATINITSTESTTGSVTIQVCPNLAVGEVYNTSGASGENICVGGGASAMEYTVMPVNSGGTSQSLTVTGTGIQAVTGPPTPDRIPVSRLLLTASAAPTGGIQKGAFGGEYSMNAAAVDGASLVHQVAMAESRHGPSVEQTPDAADGVTAADGGSQRLMWYPPRSDEGNDDSAHSPGLALMKAAMPVRDDLTPTVGALLEYNTTNACSGSPSLRTGMVRTVSAHAVVVGDTANPAGGFTTAQYDSIALEFDTIAYPTITGSFGTPRDMDSNGGRIVLFFTRAVNELSPPASSSVNLGFFARKDVSTTTECTNSNAAEILYMLVPDPTGTVNSNVRTVSFVRGNTTGTTGHELVHIINTDYRYSHGAPYEAGWLDEALAHIGEELMFYRASVGLSPRQNIQLSTLTTGPNASRRVAAFNAYANQNFGRFRAWLQRPDTAGLVNTQGASLARRGFGWAFLRYAADRINGTDATFFRALVSQDTGVVNLQAAIGVGANVHDWIRDCITGIYADDNAFTVSSDYQHPSWNYRSVYGGLGGFPLLARPLTNNAGLPLSYGAGGTTAYTRFGVAAATYANIKIQAPGATTPAATVRMALVRTK